MQRVQFWERNLSQVATVMMTTTIEKDKKSQQTQIQSAYEDIVSKFNEVIHYDCSILFLICSRFFKIRQLYRNHHIMFFAWNVGCILALKAALVCPVSIDCMYVSTISSFIRRIESKKPSFFLSKKIDHCMNRMILLKSMHRFYSSLVNDNQPIKSIIIVKD